MKKILLISMMFLLVSTFVFGVTTIRYGVWMGEQMDGIKAQVAAFEKSHPDIQVKLEQVPWDDYWVKLQTMMAGGNCWDVFTMDDGFYLKDYVVRGAILDITSFIKRDKIDLSVYPPMILAMHQVNGKYYSLPRDYDTVALFYNKDAFDKIGLKYPDWNWTWSDVILAAQKLTKRNPKGATIQWGVTTDAAALNVSQAFIFPLMLSNGVSLVSENGKVEFNTPAAKAAVRIARDLTRYGFSPMPVANAEDPFIGGKSTMQFTGAWMFGYYLKTIKSFKWGVAPLPRLGVRATISDSLGNVIWAKSKHKEAAWTFVKWLVGKEAAEILGKTGTVIPAYKGTEKAWLSYFKGEHKKDAEVFLKSVDFTHPWPCTLGESRWFDRWETYYLSEIIAGHLDVDKGLEQATSEINKIISQYSKKYSK